MYKYESIDGLAHSNNIKFIKCWDNIVKEREKKTKEFCDYLIKNGIKALHPDDGWVDRKENTIYFCYPNFKFDIKVGDKIALGDYEKYRICKVTEIIPQKLYANEMGKYKYKFEEVLDQIEQGEANEPN